MVAMTAETEWAAERQRFVEANAPGRPGTDVPAVDPDGKQTVGASTDSLLGGQFAALSRQLFAADSTVGMLERIVAAAVQVVPGAELVSLTRREDHGRLSTPVQTDELASTLDALQYTHQEGPCWQATLDTGTALALSPNLAEDQQWPRWGPAAAEHGVGSVLAVGLFPDGEPPRLGSVNCYATRAHGLDEADRDVAMLLGAHAATAVSARHQLELAQQETAQLREALQTRDVIGQAKGILMQRRGITAGQAFDVLRNASQSLNWKLRDVAHTLATQPDQF